MKWRIKKKIWSEINSLKFRSITCNIFSLPSPQYEENISNVGSDILEQTCVRVTFKTNDTARSFMRRCEIFELVGH